MNDSGHISIVDSRLSKRSTSDQHLNLSGTAQRAVGHLRKLLEKTTSVRDLEPIIAGVVNLSLHSQPYPPLVPCPEPAHISGLSTVETEVLVSLLYSFVMAASRNNGMNAEGFTKEMSRLKIPANFGQMLATLLFQNRMQLEKFPLARCADRKLVEVRWRLDVIITSHLARKIMEPAFLVSLQLASRTVYFEVPLTQFHKMRYNMAVLLQEMDNLNSRKIMQQ